MAYLDDDFNDDDLSAVEIGDDELNAVFTITEDGDIWNDESEDDDDSWDEDDSTEPLDLLDEADFINRLGKMYEDMAAMGFTDS
jgi:hypothetical protein